MGMSFNTLKCIKMTVTNKRKPIERNYIINDKIIKNENQIKYLGIRNDKKLTFKEHIQETCKMSQEVEVGPFLVIFWKEVLSWDYKSLFLGLEYCRVIWNVSF